MKNKNQKSKKNKEKEKDKNNEKEKETKNIEPEIKKEENKEINKDNENDKKIIKKPSPWVFLYGDDLLGFHLTFILMIIIPISVFFIIRNILNKFNFSRNQQDAYGVVGVLISVWMILISYIIYYFRGDFYAFFCQKDKKEKKE